MLIAEVDHWCSEQFGEPLQNSYMSGTPRCGFGKQRKWQAQPALP
jgi:hypothetical protein